MSFTDQMKKLAGLNWSFTMIEGVITYDFFIPSLIPIPEFEEVFGKGFEYLDCEYIAGVRCVVTAQKELTL